jgi:TIR domain
MPKVVISYRREDSAAIAGRISDRLKTRYGADSVYFDVENNRPGIDYRRHIYSTINKADVLLAVIGPKWLGTCPDGRLRIMEDGDLVRAEIETALRREIPVVPVLVDGAAMPKPSNLPDSINALPFHHAVAVESGVEFDQQIARLIQSLDDMIEPEPPRAPLLRWLGRPSLALSTAAAIAVLAVVAIWWFEPLKIVAEDDWLPHGRSHWAVDKSTVFLEPTGDKRQFFFVEPSKELAKQGAQPGSLLFDGRKIGAASYEGKLFVFAGRCGTREYDASGPITNNDETVTLVGKAPRLDPASCLKIDEQDRTLVFNFKRVKN